MANTEERREHVREYMRNYYLAHSTRPRMVPATEKQSKRCLYCGVVKPRSEFTVRESGAHKGQMVAYCKPCTSHYAKELRERDATIYRRVTWPSKLKTLYGITVAEYEAMLTSQGGGCAICGTKDPSLGNRQYKKRPREVFDVDHCHVTGKVRGLLCSRCNRLVGLTQNNPDVARKLMKYLG